ncbi:UNVERIFIED_CONTAM: hypothetical protein Sangu_3122100 [Sesamum angustifolium]|uniref:Uncharacterized protein n=1 Tax=Sesamum angustifolium TaxID=2727405 RepID=A0AAW2K2E5_9LAMI
MCTIESVSGGCKNSNHTTRTPAETVFAERVAAYPMGGRSWPYPSPLPGGGGGSWKSLSSVSGQAHTSWRTLSSATGVCLPAAAAAAWLGYPLLPPPPS